MDTKEKIALASQVLNTTQPSVKIVSKDGSLLERKGEKIILTEDNRELLFG